MRRVATCALVLLACACRRDPSEEMVDEHIDRSGFQPSGPVESATPAPPAISGGTLMVMRDGVTAVAADPDRDRVYVVDLATPRLTHTVLLQPGDEPGRMAEDADGNVHVALRRGGAIVSIDPRRGLISARRSVCAAPRGIAFDESFLHVACDTGELVTIAPVANAPVRVIQLGRDLRDVVVDGDRLLVSRFRRAEVLVVDADGNVERTIMPPFAPSLSHEGVFEPAVVWRMQPNPHGGALLLHQRGATFSIEVETPDGYGGGETGECTGLVQTVVSTIDADSSVPSVAPALIGGTLVTDMAIAPDGATAAFATTGHSWDQFFFPEVLLAVNPFEGIDCRSVDDALEVDGEITAVAFDALGRLIVQSREPAFLEIDGARIALSNESRADTGLALFHLDPGTGIACASCHPEGRDDGRTWAFGGMGPRRTQSLAGPLAHTAPYHWNGAFADLSGLMLEVFEHRMGSAPLDDAKRQAFARWLLADRTPARMELDPAAVARGAALFTAAGCNSCHSGDLFTNNQTADVGTGMSVQVPALVGVGARAPYMHDGCALTLHDRFGSTCGGTAHGDTSQLSAAELGDLATYLESL